MSCGVLLRIGTFLFIVWGLEPPATHVRLCLYHCLLANLVAQSSLPQQQLPCKQTKDPYPSTGAAEPPENSIFKLTPSRHPLDLNHGVAKGFKAYSYADSHRLQAFFEK